eukprot:1148024-Pelagomonas_calceolata.AAC.2
MPMTVPIAIQQQGQMEKTSTVMSFVLPNTFKDVKDVPVPTDERIQIEEVPSRETWQVPGLELKGNDRRNMCVCAHVRAYKAASLLPNIHKGCALHDFGLQGHGCHWLFMESHRGAFLEEGGILKVRLNDSDDP